MTADTRIDVRLSGIAFPRRRRLSKWGSLSREHAGKGRHAAFDSGRAGIRGTQDPLRRPSGPEGAGLFGF